MHIVKHIVILACIKNSDSKRFNSKNVFLMKFHQFCLLRNMGEFQIKHFLNTIYKFMVTIHY